jgi:hypothetical protein
VADEHTQVFWLLDTIRAPDGGKQTAMRNDLARMTRQIGKQNQIPFRARNKTFSPTKMPGRSTLARMGSNPLAPLTKVLRAHHESHLLLLPELGPRPNAQTIRAERF